MRNHTPLGEGTEHLSKWRVFALSGVATNALETGGCNPPLLNPRFWVCILAGGHVGTAPTESYQFLIPCFGFAVADASHRQRRGAHSPFRRARSSPPARFWLTGETLFQVSTYNCATSPILETASPHPQILEIADYSLAERVA
jgi:hypothetical protein